MSNTETTIQPISQLLVRLWGHLLPRRKKQFGYLLILMVTASFAEIFSIGAVLPFLGVLTAPQRVFDHPAAQPLIEVLHLTAPSQLLLPLTIVFAFAAVLAGAIRMLLLWANNRITFATGADLSITIYRNTLYQPYIVQISRNSSEIIDGISRKTEQVTGVISLIITLLSSSVMLIAILCALFAIDPLIALYAFGGFGAIYGVIISLTRKRLLVGSKRIARESAQVIKSLQEGLGGIRDVLLDRTQEVYCKIYRDADLPLRRAQGMNSFISFAPRYGMEALGMLLIAVLAYSMADQVNGATKVIPILGALALGAQRLLPVLQQTYASWSGILANQASLQGALDLLDQPLPSYANNAPTLPLPFKHSIELKGLGFRYSHSDPWVLQNINLEIIKGSRIGFMGSTGGGKSTLLDIVMGLLQPSQGQLAVDGQKISLDNYVSWQMHIAHVPQTIFLADASIAENIAFGVPLEKIDLNLVKQVAHQAQIAQSIEQWSDGYSTKVGERGIRLSGGQRQRIGIARALYKKADVIIFDEATSALDSQTEDAVMQAIEGLNKDLTILIIAHRLTTLKNCSQIVRITSGRLESVGRYQDLVSLSDASL